MRWLLAILLVAVCTPLAVEPKVIPAPLPRVITADECLAWVIHSEARGESLRGARAVLDVVYARMKKKKKGACQTISAKKQFSGYRKGAFNRVTDSMLERYRIVSKMRPVMKGCTYFHADYVSPAWKEDMEQCGQIGRHIFYKEKRNAKK